MAPNGASPSSSGSDDFKCAVGVDRADLSERPAVEQRGEVLSGLDALAFGGRKAVRNRPALVVDDGGVGDIAAVGGGRFEDGTDALIGAESGFGFAAGGDRVAGALVDHPPEQLAYAAAVFQPDTREVRQVQHAECRHRERNQDRDSGGLSGSQTDAHIGSGLL